MRTAEIYRLHYESAFTRLNPGKPLVLPPSGFGSRVLPAPALAPTPDVAASARLATGSNVPYASARPAPDATHFDRAHLQPNGDKPISVEVAEPARSASKLAGGLLDGYDVDQRLRGTLGRERDAPIEDAVSVKAHDASRGSKTRDDQHRTTTVPQNSAIPARRRRVQPDRQTVLVAGALALGIGGTTLFFAHPDPQAIALAWHTYKAAVATPSKRGAIGPSMLAGKVPSATGLSAPNAKTATQRNVATQLGTSGPMASTPVGITIPRTPTAAPDALTSQDLMPNRLDRSPLEKVSPDALRRSTDLTVQTVTVNPTTAAPTNVYESPIRKPLKALRHRAEPNTPAEPVPVHPAHRSEEADRKNARPAAGATSAAGTPPAHTTQQAQQNTNGDQKIF